MIVLSEWGDDKNMRCYPKVPELARWSTNHHVPLTQVFLSDAITDAIVSLK